MMTAAPERPRIVPKTARFVSELGPFRAGTGSLSLDDVAAPLLEDAVIVDVDFEGLCRGTRSLSD